MNKTVWFINQYASTPTCGYGGRAYYFARKLKARGYKVKLIMGNPHHLLRKKVDQGENIKEEVKDGVDVVWLKGLSYKNAHSPKRILNWFLFAFRLRCLHKYFSDQPPEIIFCSSPSLVAFEGARYLSNKFKAKLIFDVRDVWPLTLVELGGKNRFHPLIMLLKFIEMRAYRHSDYITSTLKNFDLYLESQGVSCEKFKWIPNGFDKDEYIGGPSLEKESGFFTVGYAGTFGLANALDVILQAAVILREVKDVKFVFVGEGRELEGMKQFCEKNALTNVDFKGFVPKIEVHALLKGFDVLAVGARKVDIYKFGVSPNKLFEYFNAARPVLYYIKSPNFNPVAEAGCGVEVQSGSAQEIANAILDLRSRGPEELSRMGMKGKKFAEMNYEFSVLTNKLEDLF